MKTIKRDRYRLADVAVGIVDNDLGTEGTLLDILQDATLRAFIEAREYDDQPIYISKSAWLKLELKDFSPLTRQRSTERRPNNMSDYTAKIEIVEDALELDFASIADAVAYRNINRLTERASKWWSEQRDGRELTEFELSSDLCKMQRIYVEEFAYDENDYPVFVEGKSWCALLETEGKASSIVPNPSGKKRPGRRPAEYWVPIYEELLRRILSKSDSDNSFHTLLGLKSRKAVAEGLSNYVQQKYEEYKGDKNALPEPESIASSLRNIEKNAANYGG